MKKFISIILTLTLLLSCCLLSSCGDGNVPVDEAITNEVDYSKIIFYTKTIVNGELEYVSPKNREELVGYLRLHKWVWYGCDACRINICFGSENKIPLEYMVALNVPFEYIPNEEPDGVKDTRLNVVEIKYGAYVDMEALAECIEKMVQSGKVESITFDYHLHASNE
jgi:hypothetical protein